MRNEHLQVFGIHIIRFRNAEILENTEQVIDQIKNKIDILKRKFLK